MGKKFCIPIYLENSIKLNNIYVSVDLIKKFIFEDIKTTSEVAEYLSQQCGITIGRAIVRKIFNHYNIIIPPEIKKQHNLKRADTIAKNLQEKYGVSNVFQLEQVKNKSADTKEERYGNAHFNNMEKNRKTCQKKYGVDNYSQTAQCREKIKQTNLERYGETAPAKNKEILAKMQQTCIERYGVDNYWKADVFKNQMQERYFDTFPGLSEEYKQIYKDPQKLKDFIENLEDKTIFNIAQLFGQSRESTYQLLYKMNLLNLVDLKPMQSHYETEIADYIGKDLCILNDRTILDGKEIDIYIPSKKIGIEFNGTYWHSTEVKLDRNYHLEKSKLAEQKGVRLIHIYEYEWINVNQQQKIKLMLDIALGRVKTKIYARNCEIKQITNKEAKVLNEKIHLQGHRNAQVTYGLFYNNQLVQLMSFSHIKYNKNIKNNDTWEIIRGCPGSNNIVVGGVSKLLKHFIIDYKPKKIFSYCDFNKFTGKSYEIAGMKFIGHTGPDMKWLLKNGEVVNRKPQHHKELKELAQAQIFGAGSKKYELIIE